MNKPVKIATAFASMLACSAAMAAGSATLPKSYLCTDFVELPISFEPNLASVFANHFGSLSQLPLSGILSMEPPNAASFRRTVGFASLGAVALSKTGRGLRGFLFSEPRG